MCQDYTLKSHVFDVVDSVFNFHYVFTSAEVSIYGGLEEGIEYGVLVDAEKRRVGFGEERQYSYGGRKENPIAGHRCDKQCGGGVRVGVVVVAA